MDEESYNLIKDLRDPLSREKAFAQLVDMYQERLYWHIRKIVMTHDNTNDVLQNTFIRIFRNIDSFKGKSSLLTWIFKIAYNESIRFIKKNKTEISYKSLRSNIWNLIQPSFPFKENMRN